MVEAIHAISKLRQIIPYIKCLITKPNRVDVRHFKDNRRRIRLGQNPLGATQGRQLTSFNIDFNKVNFGYMIFQDISIQSYGFDFFASDN
jgi:hypothetical protein